MWLVFLSIVNVAVSLLDWVMFPCLKMKKNANDCYELDNFAASKTSNSSARGRNAQLADREGRKDIVEEILPVLFRNGIPLSLFKTRSQPPICFATKPTHPSGRARADLLTREKRARIRICAHFFRPPRRPHPLSFGMRCTFSTQSPFAPRWV